MIGSIGGKVVFVQLAWSTGLWDSVRKIDGRAEGGVVLCWLIIYEHRVFARGDRKRACPPREQLQQQQRSTRVYFDDRLGFCSLADGYYNIYNIIT
jgi:hypothetical protein